MKIKVNGPIIDSDEQWIYDWFEVEATSPKKVNDLLENAGELEEIEVEINSGGGSVFAGTEIYTALKSHKGKVITKVTGIAASAASVILVAGDMVLMSPPAQIMVHNASGTFSGDYNQLEKGSEILKNVNAGIVNAYKLKTGLSDEELSEMMNKETWLTAEKALEKGFIDEIMFTNEIKIVASINNGMLPQEVINKMMNNRIQDSKKEQDLEKIKNSILEDLDYI